MRTGILVTRSSMPPLDEYIDEIKDMWDSHWLTNMGEKHKTFQKMLKEYMNVPNIELLTNGHMALELTMQAFGLKGEVITTPFSFASTTHAIVRNGLKPVFCDIDENTFTIDASKIEKYITKETSAIVPVHVYGNICDVKKINDIARKYNLKVIYDAAHTFGEMFDGESVGNFGDASCFSFHATKVFNSIEGGAVSYKDEVIGQCLYDLKNFGIHGPESVLSVGANAKMNEFCAAMGICNLRHLDEEILKRKKVYERYISNLKNITGLRLNKIQDKVISNYSYFPIVIDPDEFGCDRDVVFELLAENEYGARKYFYPLINDFECYKGAYDSNETPIAKYVSKNVLTLPIYADLALDDVDKICEIINKVARVK